MQIMNKENRENVREIKEAFQVFDKTIDSVSQLYN